MIRITGGEHRGRLIQTPKGEKTRPTQARLRQALFNSIQASVGEARVLDLFAGSGALGLEALSRGASQCVFVEDARAALKLIERNLEEIRVADRARVMGESVVSALKRLAEEGEPFDIVLADPPYAGGWETRLLEELDWERLLTPGGLFCLEWGVVKSKVSELPDSARFLVKIREKNYGDSVLTTYQRIETVAEESDADGDS